MPPPVTGYVVVRQQLALTPTLVTAPAGTFVVSTVISRNFNNELLQFLNDGILRTYNYDDSGRITSVLFSTNSSPELDAVVVCIRA